MIKAQAQVDFRKRYEQARKVAPYVLLIAGGLPGLARFRITRALLQGAKATVGLEPLLRMLDGLKWTQPTAAGASAAASDVIIDAATGLPVPGAASNQPMSSSRASKMPDKTPAESKNDFESALNAVKSLFEEMGSVWENSELRRKLQQRLRRSTE